MTIRRSLLVFLIIMFCPVSEARAIPPATVTLSSTTPKQGDVVRITVEVEDLCRLHGEWNNDTFPIHPSAPDTHTYTGLLGIDVTEPPGRKSLEIHGEPCQTHALTSYTHELLVRENNFKTQRLTIEDEAKVSLSSDDLKRVRREKKRIRKALSTGTATKYWYLPFADPVEGIEPGNSFGSRRIINGKPRSPHSGEDYSADVGDPIRSIAAGKVTLTGNFFFSGRSVFIDHGTGLHSMYFHLSSTNVEDGQFVREGQSIGEAGMSGRTTGPHLHLGIKLNGATADPDRLLDLK